MVRFSTSALSFQIACVFDSPLLSECLSLSASIAFFGTFAISPDAFTFDVPGSFPLAFGLASLIAFITFRFAFDIFSFISCSCVSTSSDFSGIRHPHLPFVFAFALIHLRHLQLRALTFDASDTLRFLSFLSTPAASFRIVPLRQPELQFIPIAFRISDFVSLRIVAFRPCRLSFAFDLFARISFVLRPLRLRALAFDISGVVSLAFGLADSKFLCIQFRFVSLRSRLPCFPGFVSLRAVAFRRRWPLHSVFSHSFGLAFDFSIYLRLRIVSFRLACLRLHSTSTFLHISGRPVLRPQGGGVGHRRQNKHQKHQTQNQQKKNRNNYEAAKAQESPQKSARLMPGVAGLKRCLRSRLIHGCSVQS
jgi:hypothetical protein